MVIPAMFRKNADVDVSGLAVGNEAAVLQLVVENVHEGLVMQDIYGRIEWSNPAYSRITGFSAEEILGRRPQEFILAPGAQMTPKEVENFKYDLEVFKTGSDELILNRRKNGELFWNQLTFAVVPGAHPEDTKIILICRDVTEEVERDLQLEEARNRLKHRAEHDELTGAANRIKLADHLQNCLTTARTTGAPVGVIHLDLDHFKDINDRHGHAAGDRVLQSAADVMITVVGTRGLVARIGGDEFTVVVGPPCAEVDIEAISTEVLKRLREPIPWEGGHLHVDASAGLVLDKGTKRRPGELLKCADLALYESKSSGRGRSCWYTEDIGAAYRLKRQALDEFDSALKEQSLPVYLLPQFDLVAQKTFGFEAAVRWEHPALGPVGPETFLSRTDDLRRIARLEDYTLRTGLSGMESVNLALDAPLHFSMPFQVTGPCYQEGAFCRAIGGLVDEMGIDRGQVILELHENMLKRFGETDFITCANSLAAQGFKIAIDGLGGSLVALGYLPRIKVDVVKITKTFVDGLLDGSAEAKIVKAIVRLADDLGLKTIAKGVETRAQMMVLEDLGCPIIQGSVLGEPRLVTARKPRSAT